jgi:hypothetical protein
VTPLASGHDGERDIDEERAVGQELAGRQGQRGGSKAGTTHHHAKTLGSKFLHYTMQPSATADAPWRRSGRRGL